MPRKPSLTQWKRFSSKGRARAMSAEKPPLRKWARRSPKRYDNLRRRPDVAVFAAMATMRLDDGFGAFHVRRLRLASTQRSRTLLIVNYLDVVISSRR